ncbi:penicillin-binding transpeptidase domain-containing protein [Solirubrobacter deserti]|uniref:Penicillin-binding transpeptidase domain-containing protein n=1 Tax=Solirubrobacter deserti TaxID=2282478 RepID=A0ABT4RH37_9ACTN|nr:penicillin-binding transpeptidase domain-containing protein [Solirubrobacter deserti]MDA0137865.1 penicillin-binding transpeptidase domain-containing protein [Solirubrobacter deserti]
MPRAGSPFLSPPKHARRRRRRGPSLSIVFTAIVLLGGLAAAGYAGVRAYLDEDERLPAVVAFTQAWERQDYEAMYRLLDVKSQRANPKISFLADYRRANRAATVEKVRVGRAGPLLSGGKVVVPVTVETKDFGRLPDREIEFTASENEQGEGRVAWTPALRLPGLREGEDVRRRSGAPPRRGNIYAAGGKLLDSDELGASIAGVAGDKPTGLNRIYEERLAGKRSSTLRFGDRVIARVKGTPGKSVTTTIRLGLQRQANDALGGQLGGIAIIKPSDGSVLALAGLAVSAPQPPGSVFKVVTAAAALHYKKATMGSSYPARSFATLSGAKLRNAGDSACGGSLTTSFAKSCNSVFGPLGAKVGAKRMVAISKKFGFFEQPDIPAAKISTIPEAAEMKDAIAVGSAAIGQNTDQATPLQMASVAATIANKGVRIKPWLAGTKRKRTRVVSAKVAANVRTMMIANVASGTGTAAQVPGVTVAGKTGTAELVSTGDIAQNAKNTTAWFVAFAPAQNPKVAIAVMLPNQGQGGTNAAPVAKRVLQAAL